MVNKRGALESFLNSYFFWEKNWLMDLEYVKA